MLLLAGMVVHRLGAHQSAKASSSISFDTAWANQVCCVVVKWGWVQKLWGAFWWWVGDSYLPGGPPGVHWPVSQGSLVVYHRKAHRKEQLCRDTGRHPAVQWVFRKFMWFFLMCLICSLWLSVEQWMWSKVQNQYACGVVTISTRLQKRISQRKLYVNLSVPQRCDTNCSDTARRFLRASQLNSPILVGRRCDGSACFFSIAIYMLEVSKRHPPQGHPDNLLEFYLNFPNP